MAGPSPLRAIDAAAVEAALPYGRLVERLRDGFRAGATAPVRHHHAVPRAGGADPAIMLLMPAWRENDVSGVKLVHIASGNEAKGLPSVQGVYVLFDAATGTPLAVMDGTSLTLRRTAAASALAATYLARPDAAVLAAIGAGALARHLVRAHAAVRPIREVRVWNRHPAKAARLAEELTASGLPARAAGSAEEAVEGADLVTCATMSREPLVRGAWLKPGAHLDLVGAYTPEMRESDDEAMRRGQVFVDTFEGALAEAGDVLQAMRAKALTRERILADLRGLCTGAHPGRTDAAAVTVFKSVGTALEDLVAAKLVQETVAETGAR